jgi:putative selenium metabolism protein SsnA
MLLIKNCKVIDFSGPSVGSETDIVINGSKIIDIGHGLLEKHQVSQVIDAGGKYISPGLVCSHNHFYSMLARGIMAKINPSADFISILKNLWWRLDRALDEESLYYSGITGALEAIKSGTTSVIDHNASPSFILGSLNVLKEAFEKAGLRGILAYEITDRNGEAGMREGLLESSEFVNQVEKNKQADPENYLVEGAFGGHAPFTLSDISLEKISECMKHSGRGFHLHTAEDLYDVSHSHNHYGQDIMNRLEKFGLLNDKGIFVHGVHLSNNDIEILNNHDSFLVHNPRSNMNNAVGFMNKLHLVKNKALGTDGIGSDMFDEIRFEYFKNNDAGGQLNMGDIINMLQSGNEILQRYFSRPFGKIEIGYTADLVLYDYDPPTPLVKENIAGHFIFGMGSKNVDTVIINGQVVLNHKQFTFDTSEIFTKARETSQKLWKRMDTL